MFLAAQPAAQSCPRATSTALAGRLRHGSETYHGSRVLCEFGARPNRYGITLAGSKPLMSGVAYCAGSSAHVAAYFFGNFSRRRPWDEIQSFHPYSDDRIYFDNHPRARSCSRNERVGHFDCRRSRLELPSGRLHFQHFRTIQRRLGAF
jgi:hypothetical protein